MLYQQINNEALDEDRRADLEVVRRLKQNYIDNKDKVREEIQLSSIQKNTLKKNLSAFERQLYKIIGYVEGKRETGGKIDVSEITDLIGNTILSFNSLALYIQSLSYNRLTEPDKQYIARQFSAFIASIKLSIEILKPLVDDVILSPLSEMIDKIKLRIYEPISFGVSTIATELPKQGRFRRRREENERQADIFNKLLNRNGRLKPQADLDDILLYNSLKSLGIKIKDIPRTKGERYNLLEGLLADFEDEVREIAEEDEIKRQEELDADEAIQEQLQQKMAREEEEEARRFELSDLGERERLRRKGDKLRRIEQFKAIRQAQRNLEQEREYFGEEEEEED